MKFMDCARPSYRFFQAQSMKFLFWLVMVLGKADVKNQRFDECGNSGMEMDLPPQMVFTFPAALCLGDSKF